MKFSVSLSEFQKALQKTLPAIPPKSTLPVLEHLKFTLDGNNLNIIATDQDITIMSTLGVSGSENGSVLVPGRKLSDIVKALGHTGELNFTTDVDNYSISMNTSSGKYNMKGLNPNEYLDLPELFESEKPVLDDTDPTVVKGERAAFLHKDDVIRLAEKTVTAVSTDEFRPAMTGVFFQFRKDYVNAVATDSYRLVKAVVRNEKANFPDNLDLILPARAVDQLKKVDSDVVMSVIESSGKITHTRFDIGSSTIFITRIIDEKFPPYESVIPSNNELVAIVDRSQVLSSIKRVSIFTSNISKQIRLELDNNKMVVKGQDEESGTQANEEINCDYNGQKLEIGFNFKYLEESIQNVSPEETKDNQVFFTFSEPNRPALIKPNETGDELLMLIMPVRLS